MILGAVFSHLVQTDGTKARSKPNVVAEEQAHVDEAVSAIEAKPNDAEAHYRLGVTLASRNRVDEAMAHFRKALEIKPNYAEAHYQMGLALAKKGKHAEAIAFYQKALVIKPDFVEARQQLDKAMKTNERAKGEGKRGGRVKGDK